ncbi:hypothetical protein J6590_073253, partial [Homalodisca vitripennis]
MSLGVFHRNHRIIEDNVKQKHSRYPQTRLEFQILFQVLTGIFRQVKKAASKATRLRPQFVIAIPGTYTYAHKREILSAANDANMDVECLVSHTTAGAINRFSRKSIITDVS